MRYSGKCFACDSMQSKLEDVLTLYPDHDPTIHRGKVICVDGDACTERMTDKVMGLLLEAKK